MINFKRAVLTKSDINNTSKDRVILPSILRLSNDGRRVTEPKSDTNIGMHSAISAHEESQSTKPNTKQTTSNLDERQDFGQSRNGMFNVMRSVEGSEERPSMPVQSKRKNLREIDALTSPNTRVSVYQNYSSKPAKDIANTFYIKMSEQPDGAKTTVKA